MLNSHLFLFGFLNDYLSLEMGFPPSKSVHPKLEYLKFGFILGFIVMSFSLGLGQGDLFISFYFILVIIIFIYFYFGFGGVLNSSPSFI